MLKNISHSLQADKSLSAHQGNRMEPTKVSSSSENDNISTSRDRVSLQGESTTALSYSSSMTLNAGDNGKYTMLQSLVANLLKEQGIDTKVAIGENEIVLTDLTPEEALNLVADDGYFGVEKTSSRIFQFAIGIAGGDPSRIEAIKNGIDNGFQDALDAFGGTLPDISYDTYDAVMEKLDTWVAEAQAEA